MHPVQSTLHHKIIPPRRSIAAKAPALILLHGRGANEDDLLGLADYLDERLFLVAARAPFDFHWGGGYTWYDILDVGRPEPKMLAESYQKLSQFYQDVKASYPVDPSKTFLLGFSMGTMMSYSMALTKPEAVAGVVANSGYIPEEADLNFQWDRLHNKPFFLAHGIQDPIIPVHMCRRAKTLLENANAMVECHEYTMGHEISEESLGDMSKWLTDKLDA